jgi:hypothetical protein
MSAECPITQAMVRAEELIAQGTKVTENGSVQVWDVSGVQIENCEGLAKMAAPRTLDDMVSNTLRERKADMVRLTGRPDGKDKIVGLVPVLNVITMQQILCGKEDEVTVENFRSFMRAMILNMLKRTARRTDDRGMTIVRIINSGVADVETGNGGQGETVRRSIDRNMIRSVGRQVADRFAQLAVDIQEG